MNKLLLTTLIALALQTQLFAQLIDGVAIVVKGEAITLYEIKKEMQLTKLSLKRTTDSLIRKKLEEIETKERRITVNSSEVYDDIKKTAARNNMNVSSFYEAVRNSNGMSSSDLKETIKHRLLSQKLYSAIAYSAMSEPSNSEIKQYFEEHKSSFTHPSSFTALIYQSKNQARLQEKINNPMLYAPDISTNEQVLPYDRISPKLASLLERTSLNNFTSIVPDGKGAYMSFYIKSIENAKEANIENVKNQIIKEIMSSKREEVLSNYFARLRYNADINIIRMP